MNDRLVRPSVLGEIVQILDSPAQMLYWWVFPRGIYCKEDECMVGADYLQVTIYMWHVFIFNHLTWWLVGWQDDIWFPGSAKLSINIPEFNGWLMYCVLSIAWFCFSHSLIFLYAGSVCHAQYEQSCIQVSILNSISLAVYSWNRLCLLVVMKVVSYLWFSVHPKVIFIQCLLYNGYGWGDDFLSWVFQILGLLENIALVPKVGIRVGLDFFCRPKRKCLPL